MGSESLHESPESLSPQTRDMHRAIVSLIEELEAIDWYQQRAEACTDDELRTILLHNMNEEIEHAMMGLEWIRRRQPAFDSTMRVYLNSKGPIPEIEKIDAAKETSTYPADVGAGTAPRKAGGAEDLSLGIGSLKGR